MSSRDDDDQEEDLTWMDVFKAQDARDRRAKLRLVSGEPDDDPDEPDAAEADAIQPKVVSENTSPDIAPRTPRDLTDESGCEDDEEEPLTCAACDHRRHVGRDCHREVAGGLCRCSPDEVLSSFDGDDFFGARARRDLSRDESQGSPDIQDDLLETEASGSIPDSAQGSDPDLMTLFRPDEAGFEGLAESDFSNEAEGGGEDESEDIEDLDAKMEEDEEDRQAKEAEETLKARKWKCRGCKGKPSMTCWCPWCAKAQGRCHHCAGYYNVSKPKRGKTHRRIMTAAAAQKVKRRVYMPTGVEEFDRVIGGGVLLGNILMIAGRRGTGKTVLLLRAGNEFARRHKKMSFYAAGEMTEQAMVEYMQHFRVADEKLGVYCDPEGIDVDRLMDDVESCGAKFVIIDSIQYCYSQDVKKADIGTPAMIDAVLNKLSSFAQRKKIAFLIVCHLNKSGDFAGTEKGQHMVDGLIRFEHASIFENGQKVPGTEGLRELSMDEKNRQGSANVKSLMEFFENPEKDPNALVGVLSPSSTALRILARYNSGIV